MEFGLPFDEIKATQAASLFLRLRDGRMHYLKLIKLLYIADRDALLRWGAPITMDQYVSMDHGPVLSHTYNLIVEDGPKPYWAKHISPPLGDYEVKLLGQPAETDRLSRAEENLIVEVFGKFGCRSRWEIVDFVHAFPEWRNPHGGSIPIPLREILKAGGEDETEIRSVLEELQSIGASRRALGTLP